MMPFVCFSKENPHHYVSGITAQLAAKKFVKKYNYNPNRLIERHRSQFVVPEPTYDKPLRSIRSGLSLLDYMDISSELIYKVFEIPYIAEEEHVATESSWHWPIEEYPDELGSGYYWASFPLTCLSVASEWEDYLCMVKHGLKSNGRD